MKNQVLFGALLAGGIAGALVPAFLHPRTLPPAAALAAATAARPISAAKDWEELGWSHVSVENAGSAKLRAGPRANQVLDATLVIFDGAGWTRPAISQSLEHVAATYAQCGVRLGSVQLVSARPPGGSPDISKARDLFLSQHTPASARRPVVYFVRKSSDDAASYAYHRGHCSDASCDTVWMLAETNTAQYRQKRSRNYSPLAHELLHVLTSEDHLAIGEEEDNVLGFYSDLRGDQINARQCANIRKYAYITPLK